RFAAAYREDMAALGVAPPDIEPEATGHIAEIIAMIEKLIEAGHAYAAEGHVLFSVASFSGYGKLSRRDTDEMLAGPRVDVARSRFAAAYREDMAALGVAPPDIEPEATGHIAEIIAMIEKLIEAGHAYAAEGHVLFSVASFSGYGKLSRRDTDEMLAGARVDVA